MAKREIKQWITVNGIHVPIYEGQSKGQAVKGFLENVSKVKDSKKKTLDSDKVKYDQTERKEKHLNGEDPNNSAALKQKWLEAKHKFGPYSKEAMAIKNKLDDTIEREAYEANGLKYNKAALDKAEKNIMPDPDGPNKNQMNKNKEAAAKLNTLETKKDLDKTADSLIERARKEEPQVTKDLQDIVSKGTGKLFGLDFRIKGKGSLSEKLERKAVEKGITVQEYAKKVTDVLRYTEMSNDNDLYKNFSSFVANLKAKGYEMIEVNNTWTEGSVYKGINTLVRNKNGYVFEMQFHTQRSFDVKEINHKLYEESRKLNTSKERKAELTFQMIKNAESVTFPKDINKIKNR